jgi:hypothetical protein
MSMLSYTVNCTIPIKNAGPHRESNPGPLAPEAGIIPLDYVAMQIAKGFLEIIHQ